jgi:DNA-binding protein YbaB
VAEKKRESIMVNFNQTKGQLSSLEQALKSLQLDLEKTQFALEVKKGMQHCHVHN